MGPHAECLGITTVAARWKRHTGGLVKRMDKALSFITSDSYVVLDLAVGQASRGDCPISRRASVDEGAHIPRKADCVGSWDGNGEVKGDDPPTWFKGSWSRLCWN